MFCFLRPKALYILEQEIADLVKRTDLELETIEDVVRVLKEEFED